MIYRFSIFFLLCCQVIQAQVITQISSVWDDKLDEWQILTDDDDVEGLIQIKWSDRPEEWNYELGDTIAGTIKQTWKGNNNSWDIIPAYGDRIEIKTVWKNDFTEWKISSNKKNYRLKAKYKSQRYHWSIQQSEEEEFHISMADEGDPRDWLVEDFIEAGSLDLTIAISFISIFFSL